MGTIALLNKLPPERADAWHRVRSPGGYEWWHFDALLTGNIRVSIDFFQGCPIHPQYIRRFAAYVAAPTRTDPPVPSEYPCVRLEIAEDGKAIVSQIMRYEPSQFDASENECRVRIGGNTIQPEDGKLRVVAEWVERGISVDLRFEFEPGDLIEREPVSAEMTGSLHCWVVSPRCTVSGTVQFSDDRRIVAEGRGYHDHRYGTGPIGAGIRRLIMGRACVSAQTIAFQSALGERLDVGEELKMIASDRSGHRETNAFDFAPRERTGKRTRWGLRYPASIDLAPALFLREPRVLRSDASRLWVEYDAFLNGEKGEAVCEIFYPGQLKGEFIGRWIEREIGFAPVSIQ